MSQQRNELNMNKSNNVKGPRNYNNQNINSRTSRNDYNRTDIEQQRPSSTSNSKRNPNKKNKKRSRKTKIKRIFLGLFLSLVIIFAAIGGIGFGVFAKIIENAPNLDLISVEPNAYTSIVYDMNNNEIDRFHGVENREYATLDQISVYLQNAIVAVEDERFYEHFGVDVRGILRAFISTIKNKLTGSTGVQGASTITQQLIKNNVTKVNRNTIETKLQEQYLAVVYEKKLQEKFNSKLQAKKYILELYLNTIGLGHGYNGVQAAALGYFNKDASELTLAESACIAAITNNPTLYSPRTNPENNKKRVNKILNHMLEQGLITQREYNEAMAEDIYSKVSSGGSEKKVEGNVIHGYFEDALFEQVSKDLQDQHNISKAQAENLIYSGGLQIYSTKDSNIQNILETVYLSDELFPDVVYGIDVTYTVSVENTTTGKQQHTDYRQFVKNEEEANAFVANKRAEIEQNLSSDETILADRTTLSIQPQSSMVIMDYKQGYVRGLIGGRGEKTVNRGFNRATDSQRQPGSVFKILAAYAPAIDMGVLMPGSIIIDEPYTKADYSPKNWYGESYKGPSTVREGIEQSMNILAVKAMEMAGVDNAYKYLLNFGFTTLEDDNHLSTALGGITYGVTQIEVTAAYGTIANKGNYYEPKFYTKVLDHDGNVILDATDREPTQVLKETTAYMLTDMMQGVVTSGTGTAAKFKNISMPIAGKTGTTQETRDLTFVGYTPYYVAGIWFGYDRYDDTVSSMNATVNGKRVIANDKYHLNIWREVMEQIHKDLPTISFGARPSDIIEVTISKETGLLATEECRLAGEEIITELFLKGTEPQAYCEAHNTTQVTICKDSHLLAGEFCPEDSIEIITVRQYLDENGNLVSSIPTEICDVHLEGDLELNPELSFYDTDNSEENSINSSSNNTITNTPQIDTIVPSGISSGNTDTEKSTQTTTYSETLGNLIQSTPSEPSTEEIQTTTQAPIIVEETVGDPIFELP